MIYSNVVDFMVTNTLTGRKSQDGNYILPELSDVVKLNNMN